MTLTKAVLEAVVELKLRVGPREDKKRHLSSTLEFSTDITPTQSQVLTYRCELEQQLRFVEQTKQRFVWELGEEKIWVIL